MQRAVRSLVVLVVVALVAAACSSDDEAASPDLESVGTEAWMGDGADGAPVDPDAPAVGPSDGDDPTGPGPVEVPTGGPATAPPTASPDAPLDPGEAVDQLVQAMTVEQKVGQLFTSTVIGDDAVDVSESAATANQALFGVSTPAEVVQRYHLGGVAYFDHDQGPGTSNVAELDRTADLSTGLQQAAATDTGIGLLVGADQEGGSVVRLRAPATVFPAARDIAATGDLALAADVGRVIGTEALAVGINWVYAPVADVNVNPANPVIGDRAFGTTAEVVVPLVEATAAGLATSGVLPTLKHFPGHGDTEIDSHSSLPTIDHDRATLESVDWPPFTAGIDVRPISVMVGHLAVPALDPSGRPATISPPIISALREDLGYGGLVVTDAMDMGALTGFGDSGSLAVDAINAGVDMVLMPTDLPAAWTAVRDAALSGAIHAERLDQAVANVLAAKVAIGALDARVVAERIDPTVLGAPEHTDVLARVQAACGC